MEHRWNSRQEINSTVMVYLEHFGVIRAQVKNISGDGMLLKTDRCELRKGAIVELICASVRALESGIARLRALIIHANDGLVGLMFIEDREKVAALWGDYQDDDAEDACRSMSGMNDVFENSNPNRVVEYASL